MSYQAFVSLNSGSFEDTQLLKSACDLAKLLDHPALNIDPEGDNCNSGRIAEARGDIFHDFCALCVVSKVAVPDLEPQLYEPYLPARKKFDKKNIASAKLVKEHVLSQLRNIRTAQARTCRALAEALCIFPKEDGYMGITQKEILAVINHTFHSLGLQPICPDYEIREVKTREGEDGPNKMTTLLIVDDNFGDTFKTARALCGWPNLNTEIFLYKSQDRSKDKEIKRASTEIIGLSPVIVAMDKDMYPIKGADLIRALRESEEGQKYIFVANTGGDPDELYEVSCFTNCDKGRNLEGIRRAISRI